MIDPSLIALAREMLDEEKICRRCMPLLVKTLWPLVTEMAEPYHDLLAMIEVLVVLDPDMDDLTLDQMCVLRSAFFHLGSGTLNRDIVDLLRGDFAEAGLPAMPFLEST